MKVVTDNIFHYIVFIWPHRKSAVFLYPKTFYIFTCERFKEFSEDILDESLNDGNT